MADPSKIELELLALTEQARATLDQFISEGEAGLNRLAAIGEEGVPLNVARAKVALDGLLSEARALEDEVEAGATVRINAGASIEILEGVQAELAAVELSLDTVASAAVADLERTGSAISGVAAAAATSLQAGFAPLRELGAQLATDLAPATEALAQLQEQEAQVAAEAARLANPFVDSLAEVDAALAEAAAATEAFEARASTSGRGVQRTMASLQITIGQLTAEIAALSAQGADTSRQQAALSEIQAGYVRATAAAGKFRAEQKLAGDELRRATVDAGELRGQFGGMEDVVGRISPAMGKLVAPVLGLQAAVSLAQVALTSLLSSGADFAEVLGGDRKEAEALGKELESRLSLNPVTQIVARLRELKDVFREMSAEVTEFAVSGQGPLADLDVKLLRMGGSAQGVATLASEFRSLANVLAASGIPATGRSMDELRDQELRLIETHRTLVQRSQELTGAVLGIRDAIEERSRALLASSDILIAQDRLSVDGARAVIAEIDSEIASYRKLGLDVQTLEDQRRDLIDLTTKALIKENSEVLKLGDASATATARVVNAVNQQLAALDALGRKNQGVEQQRSVLIDQTVEALRRRGDALLADGRATSAQAEEFRTEIQHEIDAVERLGQSGEKLEALKRQFEALQRAAQLDGLSEGLRKLRDFAQLAQSGGQISAEEADQIVADYNRIAKAIEALPEVERKQYEGRLKEAQSYYSQFFKFTTEYRDAVLKQAEYIVQVEEKEKKATEERIKTLKAFADAVRAAAKDLPDSQQPKAGSSAADLTREIADKQAQLRDLESKTFQAPADLGTMDQLRKEIQGLTQDLRALGSGAESAGGDFADLGSVGQAAAGKIEQSITQLIQGSDAFRTAFKALPPEVKAAVEQLTSGFVSDLRSGLVRSEEDVQYFVERFTKLLSQGGAVSGPLVAQLQEIGGGAKAAGNDLSHLFDGLRTSVPQEQQALQSFANELLRQLGISKQVIVTLDAEGNAHVRLADEVRKQAAAVANASSSSKQGTIELSRHAEAAKAAASDVRELSAAEQQAASESSAAAAAATTAGSATSASGQQASGASEGYIRLSQSTNDTTQRFGEFVAAQRAAADGAAPAATGVQQVGSAVAQEGAAADDGVARIKGLKQEHIELKTASDGTTEAVQQTGAAVEQTGNDLTDAAGRGGDLKQSYVEITKGAREAGEGIHRTGEAATEAASGVQKLTDEHQQLDTAVKEVSKDTAEGTSQVKALTDAVQGASDSTARLTPAARELITTLADGKATIGDVADNLKRLTDSGAADTLAKVAQGMHDSAEGAKELLGQLKDSAAQVSDLKKALDELATSSGKWREELKGEKEDCIALNKVVSETLSLCKQLAACQAGSGG